ncbi:glucoamylase family protein [Neptunicella sp. SCSIO 80796]|uniref:glucoamylase family protein n=1 Tax=Neptunicella plasticusilytica TaxID=3117012 RepID=UPI003A4D3B52
MRYKWFGYLAAGLLALTSQLAIAAGLTAQGYDRHVELFWQDLAKSNHEYQLWVKIDGGDWQQRQSVSSDSVIDFTGDLGRNLALTYKLVDAATSKELGQVKVSTRDFSDDELLDMVQRYTFRYFWDDADPKTGWAHERQPNMKDGNIITSGGTGFGIASVITGAERGWISREQAVDRMLKLTKSLATMERFHGMWGHWYNADTGKIFHFSKYDDGGDTVESAFMAQGLLTARQYFNAGSKKEQQLRQEITALWEAMDWQWYTQGQDVMYWHWSKNYGFKMNHAIKGYNEALIVYVLAASSPTHATSDQPYHKGWAGWDVPTFRNYQDYYGMALPLGNKEHKGGPLFFAHYSFMGLDPRGLRDRYANYWQQNVRHTLINRAYVMDNPYAWKGYGEDFWGLTAGDNVPDGYTAHAPGFQRDHGTITPTAALSSMPYTPKESMQVLKNLYFNHGKELFGKMGFYDGINLSVSDDPQQQVRKTYLAIDQGPIVGMIENYRSGLLWNAFMRDPDIRKGLNKLGFSIKGQAIKPKQ